MQAHLRRQVAAACVLTAPGAGRYLTAPGAGRFLTLSGVGRFLTVPGAGRFLSVPGAGRFLSMPGVGRLLSVSGARHLLLAAGAALLLSAPAEAQTPGRAQANLATEVPAGQRRQLRIRNVPQDARLAIAAQASARIALSLMTEADASRLPEPGEPLFSAPLERTLSFSVSIPASGTYVLVLDNTKGETPSQVRILVRASRGGGATATPPQQRPPDAEPGAPRLRSIAPQHEM